jgi:predicted Zn finger-like uncharacterized protein
MRLQCPNCDAEYEVDASAIPFEGRDVQCSNCGHGWFQVHPDFEADQDIEAALYDPPPPLPQDVRPTAPPRPAFISDVQSTGDDSTQQDPPKREIDPEALRILREEVAYEAAKRATEGNPVASIRAAAANLEASKAAARKEAFSIEDELDKVISSPPSQADSAPEIADDQRGSVIVARRVARLKGVGEGGNTGAATFSTGPQTAPEVAAAPPQRAVLRDEFPPEDAPRKTGKKLGFYTGILAALGASAAYILAPEIAASLPQIAAPLGQYVEGVNALRDGLDGLIGTVMTNAVPQAVQFGADLLQRAMDFIGQLGWI